MLGDKQRARNEEEEKSRGRVRVRQDVFNFSQLLCQLLIGVCVIIEINQSINQHLRLY